MVAPEEKGLVGRPVEVGLLFARHSHLDPVGTPPTDGPVRPSVSYDRSTSDPTRPEGRGVSGKDRSGSQRSRVHAPVAAPTDTDRSKSSGRRGGPRGLRRDARRDEEVVRGTWAVHKHRYLNTGRPFDLDAPTGKETRDGPTVRV